MHIECLLWSQPRYHCTPCFAKHKYLKHKNEWCEPFGQEPYDKHHIQNHTQQHLSHCSWLKQMHDKMVQSFIHPPKKAPKYSRLQSAFCFYPLPEGGTTWQDQYCCNFWKFTTSSSTFTKFLLYLIDHHSLADYNRMLGHYKCVSAVPVLFRLFIEL